MLKYSWIHAQFSTSEFFFGVLHFLQVVHEALGFSLERSQIFLLYKFTVFAFFNHPKTLNRTSTFKAVVERFIRGIWEILLKTN